MSELQACLSGTWWFMQRQASQSRSYGPDRANAPVALYLSQGYGYPLGGPCLLALVHSGLKADAEFRRSCLE